MQKKAKTVQMHSVISNSLKGWIYFICSYNVEVVFSFNAKSCHANSCSTMINCPVLVMIWGHTLPQHLTPIPIYMYIAVVLKASLFTYSVWFLLVNILPTMRARPLNIKLQVQCQNSHVLAIHLNALTTDR